MAYGFSGLLLCLFLALAYRYAQGWTWSYLLTVWALWFAIFLGGFGSPSGAGSRGERTARVRSPRKMEA